MHTIKVIVYMLKMHIPGQPETLSLIKSNTNSYLSLMLRLSAQWFTVAVDVPVRPWIFQVEKT